MSRTPAPAATAALTQATLRWPRRNRASDGVCGDAAHAKRRSDHNPGKAGYCHAVDLTHDRVNGPDGAVVAEALRAACASGAERRATYIIFAGRIASASKGWRWRAYGGSNPHNSHIHVSIVDTKAACEDTRPWPGIAAPAGVTVAPPPPAKPPAQAAYVRYSIHSRTDASFEAELMALARTHGKALTRETTTRDAHKAWPGKRLN